MDIISTVKHMSEDMYLRMKHAAETGKWPEGTPVEQEQRDMALQISMAYQAIHLDSNEMLTIGANGEMVHKSKREIKAEFVNEEKADSQDIARFTHL
ncbi:YeaC family protein [Thalassotalea fusca]